MINPVQEATRALVTGGTGFVGRPGDRSAAARPLRGSRRAARRSLISDARAECVMRGVE